MSFVSFKFGLILALIELFFPFLEVGLHLILPIGDIIEDVL